MKMTSVSKAEVFLVLILLIIGIPMIVLIPPGAGYDEEDHLVRVWEISHGSFIPGQIPAQEMKYPKIFRDVAFRHLAVEGIIDTQFWQTYTGVSLDEHGYVSREINTKSVYSPALLLPQAVILRYAGIKADMPALVVFYLCRLAGLISYLILVWLAIRLIPFGKWILLVLAASPMAIFQATTVSADTLSNGIGFLFIAGSLAINGFEKIGWKESGYLLLLISLLFLAKLNLIPLIVLPFLIIHPSRFANKGIYAVLLGLVVFLFAIEVLWWNWIAARSVDSVLTNEADPGAQLQHILHYPLIFLKTIASDLLANGFTYFQGWINGYGYYYWTPPQIASLFFLLSLCAALFLDLTPDWVSKKIIIVFLGIFALGYLATISSLYLFFTPVGANKVLGVQGRYFIPLTLSLFLAISSLRVMKNTSLISPNLTKGFLAFALSLNVTGIILAFYIPCGTTFYRTGLCYQPVFKDFTPESYVSQPMSRELSISQEIRVSCNGLSELQILLFPSKSENTATTQFIFRDATNDKIVVHESMINNLITAESWHKLSFDPEWQSAGKRYVLEVLGENSQADQGIQLLYSPQAEFEIGDLYENGERKQQHLVLQYGCMTGLRKIWLTGKL